MAVQMPYSWKPRDPADIRREARLLALALEYSWRLGAFACLYSLVDGSREASTVGEKAGFLVVVLAFCLTTRLDIATIVLALLVVSYLVAATDPAPLETIVSNALSIEFALGWVALWLVVGAGVLRSVAAEPKPGFVDRDMALLVIGWIAATQVLVATQIAAGGQWPSVYEDDGFASFAPVLVQGEPALFLQAGAASLIVGMAALTLFAALRARSRRVPGALQAHALTGAFVSAFAYMIAGNSIAAEFGSRPGEYQWFGAVMGAGAGLLVRFLFCTLTRNQHLRTWGAIRVLALGSIVALSAAGLGASLANPDAGGGIAAVVLLLGAGLPLARDTWRRAGGTRLEIERHYRRALRLEAMLDPDALEQIADARPHLRRAKAVHAAATGDDPSILDEAPPAWQNDDVPDLSWLREAAEAGRWQAFRNVTFQHAGALDELKDAVRQLEALAMASWSPPSHPPDQLAASA